MNKRFAVVRSDGRDYKFAKFHKTLDEATKEAERLCEKEEVGFFIVELVGHCKPKKTPVQWVYLKGSVLI